MVRQKICHLQAVKNCLFHDFAVLQVLHDNSFQEPFVNAGIPNAFWIHNQHRPRRANAKTRRLTAFDSVRAEKETLPLEETGQERVKTSAGLLR